MKKTRFIVPPKSDKKRLDIFVSEELQVSRSQAQKLIAADCVTVNGKLPKKAGDGVKEGDEVKISNSHFPISKQNNTHSNETVKQSNNRPEEKNVLDTIEVVHETEDYVVLNKPSGLLVHPTQANEKNSLVSWLVKKYPKIKKVGDDPSVRPGIVHRLDKEASGLMVVAKTQKMFEHLKEQFKNRTIQKEYFALAHGKVAKDWDEINFPIARGENFDRMAARPLRTVIPTTQEESLSQSKQDRDPSLDARDDNGEKQAKTEFLVEKRFANCTLLRVILHTGRMHQIRVHMLAYNHPLVGDPLYFQKKRKKNLDEKCGRLFLHSVSLAFTDLEGDRRSFEAPLPQQLQTFLKTLH